MHTFKNTFRLYGLEDAILVIKLHERLEDILFDAAQRIGKARESDKLKGIIDAFYDIYHFEVRVEAGFCEKHGINRDVLREIKRLIKRLTNLSDQTDFGIGDTSTDEAIADELRRLLRSEQYKR